MESEEVATERYGVRLRLENVTYIETVMSTTLEYKSNTLVGAEALVWF